MSAREPIKTIDQLFEEFLAEQKARLSPRTLRKYDDILDLFRSCLEGYWPGHDQEEYNRISGAGGTFCGTFGPEELPGGVGEFLGYFMPHKVIAGKEMMKAAGTVTKKLMKWLAAKGYVEDTQRLATDGGVECVPVRRRRSPRRSRTQCWSESKRSTRPKAVAF